MSHRILSGLLAVLALVGLGIVPRASHAVTGACGAGFIAPSASSFTAVASDDGKLVSPANASGGSSLPVALPLPADVAAQWTICGASDANKSTVFNAPSLAPPATPSLSQVSGGSISATTYYVKTSYVNVVGETLPSTEASLSVSLNNLLRVASPGASGNATGYNVYVGTASGNQTKQNSTPIALGTNWTEPLGGLVAGAAAPSSGTATAAYILGGSRTLASLTLGPGNYEYATLQSDGSNYRIATVSRATALAAGLISTGAGSWTYLQTTGYTATVGDNGMILSSALAGGAVTITLPVVSTIPAGWASSLYPDVNRITVQPPAGGTLIDPTGASVSSYTTSSPPGFTQLSFDGAAFRILGPPQPQIVADNAALAALSSTTYANIVRAAYLNVGGVSIPAPPLHYTTSAAACSIIGAVVTGSISGLVLNVSAVANGELRPGMVVPGALPGTVITALGTATNGTGTYTVNKSQTLGNGTLTFKGDGGAQVPLADGGCANASMSGRDDVRWWGGKIDPTFAFDSGPAIRSVASWTQVGGGAVFVPSDGVYTINTAVAGMHPWGTCIQASTGLRIEGDRIGGIGSGGRSVLPSTIYCRVDADGISPKDSARVNNVSTIYFTLVGHAVNATQPHPTSCVTSGIATGWRHESFACKNFVDHINHDHSIAGGGAQQLMTNVILSHQDGYPRKINGYPRFAYWSHGASGQDQNLVASNVQAMAMQIISSCGFVGDGVTVSFVCDLSKTWSATTKYYLYDALGLSPIRVADQLNQRDTYSLGATGNLGYTLADVTVGAPASTIYGATVTGTFAQGSNTVTFPTPTSGLLPPSLSCSGTDYYNCDINLRLSGYDIPADAVVTSLSSVGGTTTATWISPSGSENIVGSISPKTASVSGYISGTTLYVTAADSDPINNPVVVGATVSGSGITSGTKILEQISGTTGGAGAYKVSISQTVASVGSPIAISVTYGSIAVTSGNLLAAQVGWNIIGAASGTKLSRIVSSTSGYVNLTQTISTGTSMRLVIGTGIGATETLTISEFALAEKPGCNFMMPADQPFSSTPVTSNCGQKIQVTFNVAPADKAQVTVGYVDPWGMVGFNCDGGGAGAGCSNNDFGGLSISSYRRLINDTSAGRNRWEVSYVQMTRECAWINSPGNRVRVSQSSSFSVIDGCTGPEVGPFAAADPVSKIILDSRENITGTHLTPRNVLICADFNTCPWPRGGSFTGIGSTPTGTAPGWFGWTSSGSDLAIANAGGASVKIQRAAGSSSTGRKCFGHVVPTVIARRLVTSTDGVVVSFALLLGPDFSAAGNAVNFILATGTGVDQGWAGFIDKTWTNYKELLNITYDGGDGKPIQRPLGSGFDGEEVGLMWCFTPTGTAGANDWVRVLTPQLERGLAASPFEYKSAALSNLEAGQIYQQSAVGAVVGNGPGQVAGVTAAFVGEEFHYLTGTYAPIAHVRFPFPLICTSPSIVIKSPQTGVAGKLYASGAATDRNVVTTGIGDLATSTAGKHGFGWRDESTESSGYVSLQWAAACSPEIAQ